jgi:hypothetical protein
MATPSKNLVVTRFDGLFLDYVLSMFGVGLLLRSFGNQRELLFPLGGGWAVVSGLLVAAMGLKTAPKAPDASSTKM